MQVVATAGHVDHGKSALLSRLTGMEPDRWDEERRRGLTIDLGYVWTTLEPSVGDPVTVAFVDVPGHDHFLPNMLCGVGVVDQVLFVVAADDGWSAQSEEHLQIVDLLGLRGTVAAVTKTDLVDGSRVRQVVDDVERRLEGTSLVGTPVVAVDALSGAGFDELRAMLAQRLGAADVPPAVGAARLWVDRAFTVQGAGLVVTGMLTSGELRTGQPVAVLPGGHAARIRGLQSLGDPVERAVAGSRVAVNLSGLDHGQVERGATVVDLTSDGVANGVVSADLDVEVRALPHAAIGRKGDWHLHLGTAAVTATVLPLVGEVDAGSNGVVRLALTEPVPVRVGDPFVLREAGRRVIAGGGAVLDPQPLQRPRGPDRRLAHALVMEELAAATTPAQRAAALVDAHRGVRRHQPLSAALGADPPASGPGQPGGLVRLADHLVRADLLEDWVQAVDDEAAAHQPERAVATSRLHAAVTARGCPPELTDAVVDAAADRGVLARHGGRLVHHRHEDRYLAARRRRQQRLLDLLDASPLEPPDPTIAAQQAGIESFEVQALLDDGEVVACGPLLFLPGAVESAATLLRDGPGRDGAAFTAAEARDVWGTTRRCAVPLLEHLRATGVTTFDGTHHRVRATR